MTYRGHLDESLAEIVPSILEQFTEIDYWNNDM